MTGEDWVPGDPFADPGDPAAAERERRRIERERRRIEREAEESAVEHPAAERPAQPPAPEPPVPEQRASEPRDSDPGASEPTVPEPQPYPGTSTPGTRAPLADRIADMRARGERRAPVRARPALERTGRGFGTALRRAATRPAPVAALIAIVLGAWFLYALFQPFHGEGAGEVRITVPKGASVSEIGDLLDEAGVITSGTLFELRATMQGKRDELYPGNFVLASGMSYGDAIEALSTPPEVRTITLTIPEGLARAEVAPVVREAGISGNYVAATKRFAGFDPTEFGAPAGASLEGFLFPATYELPANATVEDLIERQLQAFEDQLGEINLDHAQKKNLNVFDVVNIAAMIEREIDLEEELPLAADVIYNRLAADEPLGIDATVRFAVGNFTEPLTVSELDVESPYNTRERVGLPPGPIGSPGAAALDAAANPAGTDFFFYVVKPYTCGEHAFSETLEEHNAAAAEYDAALEREGEAPTRC